MKGLNILSDDYTKRKKTYAIVSAVVVLILTALLTYFVFVEFRKFGSTPEQFRDFVQSFGWSGRLVALGVQILQVIIALIPGEAVEIGLGYAFGAIEGTLICYAGNIIAATVIFMLTRKLGIKFVEIFVSREKIDEIRFINTEKKLKRTIFILFFVPGIPKDIVTYFVGLTKIKLHEFLILSSIARIPSVVSSTIGGSVVGDGNYLTAAIIFAITGAISLVCLLLYNKASKKRRSAREQ